MNRIIKQITILLITLVSSFSIKAQCDVTEAMIFLNGEDVTGETVDVCVTDLINLQGTIPDTSVGETGQWQIVSGTTVVGVSGMNPDQGIILLNEVSAPATIETELTWTITSPITTCSSAGGGVKIRVHEEPISEIVYLSNNDVCEEFGLITLETRDIGRIDFGTTDRWTSVTDSELPTETSEGNWVVNTKSMNIGNNAYVYIVENPGCSTVLDNRDISINPMVNSNFVVPIINTLCVGADLTVDLTFVEGEGNSPIYTWVYGSESPVKTNLSSYTLQNLQAPGGTLSVTLTSNELCQTGDLRRSINIDVIPGAYLEILNSGDILVCEDEFVTLSAIDNTVYSQSSQLPVYQWYKNSIPIKGETDVTMLKDISESGLYSIGADNRICNPVVTNEIDIDIRQIPQVNASANGINPITGFEGDQLNLTGTHTGTIAGWSSETFVGIVDPSDLNGVIMTENNTGFHTITLSAIDGPCLASDEVLLNIKKCISSTPNQSLSRSEASVFYAPEVKGQEAGLLLEVYTEDGSLYAEYIISQDEPLRGNQLEKGLYGYRLVNLENGEVLRTGAIQVVN